MIRVLIADDSRTFRMLLRDVLEADGKIEVVGEAANGAEAIALATELAPDLITMDLRMPGIDGLAATEEIMRRAPTPIVILTGDAGATEAAFGMSALRAGALTVLPKFAGPTDPEFREQARRLVRTVNALSEVKVIRRRDTRSRRSPLPDLGSQPASLIAIAASAGGPAALRRILADLPAHFALPIVLVQHIAAGFATGLARWLAGECALPVVAAEHQMPLQPGRVHVAPDDRHLLVTTRELLLSDDPPIGFFRPSATALFRSSATAFGSRTVALVLTGLGSDGVAGLADIRARGGRILVQDERSCLVYGMPGAAVASGVVDAQLPLGQIAPVLTALAELAPGSGAYRRPQLDDEGM